MCYYFSCSVLIGGAAGAASRITGTLGKGIAALTLDKDYQKKRRQNISRRPQDFTHGIAESGKGLVMVKLLCITCCSDVIS